MKNKPYVKMYDKNGIIKNPIKTGYLHDFENRRERRSLLHKKRFFGNGKNIHLTVIKLSKYLRFRQYLFDDETGMVKTIEHYIERK